MDAPIAQPGQRKKAPAPQRPKARSREGRRRSARDAAADQRQTRCRGSDKEGREAGGRGVRSRKPRAHRRAPGRRGRESKEGELGQTSAKGLFPRRGVDRGKFAAEVEVDRLDRADDRQRDAAGDQAIFDGSGRQIDRSRSLKTADAFKTPVDALRDLPAPICRRNLGRIGCQRVEEHAQRWVKAEVDLSSNVPDGPVLPTFQNTGGGHLTA